MKLIMILAIMASAFSLACGDGPSQPTTDMERAPIEVPTDPSTPAPASSSDEPEFSCTNGPVMLIGLTLNRQLFNGPVEGFHLVGCFTDISVAQLSGQLGVVLSEALAAQHSQTPLRTEIEITAFSGVFLTEFLRNVMGNSMLIVNGQVSGGSFVLIPILAPIGPTA